MPALQKVDPLVVQMSFAYNIPWTTVGLGSVTWSSFSGQANVSYSSLSSQTPICLYTVLCYRDHFVVLRTPGLPPGSYNGNAVTVAAGGQYGVVWCNTNNGEEAIQYGQWMGIPFGNPLTANKPLYISTRDAHYGVNGTVTGGQHRFGWTYGRPVLGGWRSSTLSPGNFQCYKTDGTIMTCPTGGFSTLVLNSIFDTPRGSVIPYQDGFINFVQRNSAQQFFFFGEGQAFREEAVTLAGDAPANVLFQAVSNLNGTRTAAGSSGWIVDLGPGTGIFPNQGKRFIYISKTTMTWRDIQLVAMDATANARISNPGNESFNICQNELDGLYYGKAGTASAISNQILVSPLPPVQILPKLVPMFGLPKYGIYDKPYGVTR